MKFVQLVKAPIEGIKKESIRNLVESNLESVIWCMKHELAQMKKQENKNGTPSIVNNGTALVQK